MRTHCHWPSLGLYIQAALQLWGSVTREMVFSGVIPVHDQMLLPSSNFTQGSKPFRSKHESLLYRVALSDISLALINSLSYLHTSLSDPSPNLL